MSFTLIDLSSENIQFDANVWNWRAALGVIKSFNIVSEGSLRQMSSNASGTSVSQEEAHVIAQKIREEILPKLEPNKRIFEDLSVTDKPDDGTIYKDKDEQWKNYSANRDWMAELADFLHKSKGFKVY